MATPPRGAGALRDRVALQRRSLDANNDPLGPWETVEVRRAEVINLRGGEGVQAQRLQGLQPVVVAVRADSLTRSLDTAWQAVNERTGQVYDITSATETTDRAWVEILGVAKSGAAAQAETQRHGSRPVPPRLSLHAVTSTTGHHQVPRRPRLHRQTRVRGRRHGGGRGGCRTRPAAPLGASD